MSSPEDKGMEEGNPQTEGAEEAKAQRLEITTYSGNWSMEW